MVNGFCFGWWDVADRPQQAFVVEPVDPIERGQFDRFQVPPRATVDHLRLVQSVDRLGQGVVVGITDAADRGLYARLGERSVYRMLTYCDPLSE